MDLGFAISATAGQKDRTFQLMKDTMKAIVDQYGTEKIHYSVIVYDRVPTTRVSFEREMPNRETLKRIIDALPQVEFKGVQTFFSLF